MFHMVKKKGVSPNSFILCWRYLDFFCKRNEGILLSLLRLLDIYEKSSGQAVNKAKRKIYFGGGTFD